MDRLRVSCAVWLAWFAVLLNVERLFAPVNLASFVYVTAASVALLIVLLPTIPQLLSYWLLVLPVPLILSLKLGLGYGIGGADFPLTVTEICAVQVTIAISLWLSRCLTSVREAIAELLMGETSHRSLSFDDGQRQMYREVRRARVYQRPLALLAVAPTADSAQSVTNQFLQDIQRETAQRKLFATMAEILSAHTKSCDIVAQRGEHFLVMLPELDQTGARRAVQQLTTAAREALGLELKTGLAVFPEEEVTFVKLLDRAEARLAADDEASTAETNLIASTTPPMELPVVPTTAPT